MSDLSARILDFPVRAAAVEDFRRRLASSGLGDLSALAATIGDSAMFAELLAMWLDRGWVVRSPSSPMYAYPGPGFSADLGLRDFCGESIGYDPPAPEDGGETPAT